MAGKGGYSGPTPTGKKARAHRALECGCTLSCHPQRTQAAAARVLVVEGGKLSAPICSVLCESKFQVASIHDGLFVDAYAFWLLPSSRSRLPGRPRVGVQTPCGGRKPARQLHAHRSFLRERRRRVPRALELQGAPWGFIAPPSLNQHARKCFADWSSRVHRPRDRRSICAALIRARHSGPCRGVTIRCRRPAQRLRGQKRAFHPASGQTSGVADGGYSGRLRRVRPRQGRRKRAGGGAGVRVGCA